MLKFISSPCFEISVLAVDMCLYVVYLIVQKSMPLITYSIIQKKKDLYSGIPSLHLCFNINFKIHNKTLLTKVKLNLTASSLLRVGT